MTHWTDRRDEYLDREPLVLAAGIGRPGLRDAGSGPALNTTARLRPVWGCRRIGSLSSFRRFLKSQRQGLLRIEASIGEKARAIIRDELIREPRAQILGTQAAEIAIEVVVQGHEFANVDATMTFVQPF
jgi:hypothetical protein